jgi:hypothetical protein
MREGREATEGKNVSEKSFAGVAAFLLFFLHILLYNSPCSV